jgi:replicative DNA helicase
MTDRQPPQNLEAERGCLGGCMLFAKALPGVTEILSPEDFWRDAHSHVFKAIAALHAHGTEVDAVTVADWLIKAGIYHEIGGDELLSELVHSVPHGANAVYYAEIIRQRADVRRMIEISTKITEDAYSNQFTASELISTAEQDIFAIGERALRSQMMASGPLMEETLARLDLRREGAMVGITTGFDDLDFMIRGLCPANLIIVAGRPSQGKTAFALEIMRRVAFRLHHVLFVSLEMSRMELGDRLLSTESGIDGYQIYNPRELRDRDDGRLEGAADRLSRMTFKIDDAPARTVAQIAACARRAKSRDGLELLVIDYMSLIDGQRKKGESRQEEVARISRALKQLSRELYIPVMCLCQLNRQNELRDEKRPRLADLRESGQIEQDADAVLMLHRPEYYDPNDRPGEADLIVAKNRNGQTGNVRLVFNKACTQFHSWIAAEQSPDVAF